MNVPSPIVQTDGTQIPPTAKLRNIHTTRNLRKLDHRPLQKKGTTWRLKPKSPFSVLKLPHAKAPITRRPRLPKPLVLLPPRQPNPSDSILPRALKSPNSKARRPNPYIASDSPPLGFLSPDSNPSDSSDNEDSASNGSEVLVVSDDSDSSLSEHPSSPGSLDSDSPMFDLFQRTELILQFDSQSRLVVCVGCSHPEVVFTRTMKQHLRRFHGANAARHFQLAQRFFDAHPRRTETFPTNLLSPLPVITINRKVKCDGCSRCWLQDEERPCSCNSNTRRIGTQRCTVDGPELEVLTWFIGAATTSQESFPLMSPESDTGSIDSIYGREQIDLPYGDLVKLIDPANLSLAEAHLIYLTSWLQYAAVQTIGRLGFPDDIDTNLNGLTRDGTLELAMLHIMRTYRSNLSYLLSGRLRQALDRMVIALDSPLPSRRRYDEDDWSFLDAADTAVLDAIYCLLSQSLGGEFTECPFISVMAKWSTSGPEWFTGEQTYRRVLLFLKTRLLTMLFRKACVEAPEDPRGWIAESAALFDPRGNQALGKMIHFEHVMEMSGDTLSNSSSV